MGAIVAVLAVLAVVAGIAISRSSSAAGDVSSVGGGAFGESINIHSILGINVKSGPMPKVDLPSGGGGPISDDLASVGVPGVLSAGLLKVSTQGVPGPSGFATSSASVADVNLAGGAITIGLITSTCRSQESGTTASSSLANVTAAGVAVPVAPAPNTTVVIPLVGTLILNEQTRPNGTDIVVNALHLKLNSAVLGTGDIILSQSRCELAAPSAVVPVGTIGGLGLAAVLGGVFFWRVTRRRPELHTSAQ